MNNFFKKIKVGVLCNSCGKTYEKTSPNQKYCINCQKGNHLRISKDWYKRNKDKVREKGILYRKNNPDLYLKRDKKKIYKYNHSAKGIYNGLKKRCLAENNPNKLQITQDEFIKWYGKQDKKCIYCDIPEKLIYLLKDKTSYPVTRLTIDRKDNSLPYTINNISLACFRCNNLKKDFFTFKEMREIAQKYIKLRWEVLNG
jgi:hypothetical protein